jgi:hypothetical protein
VLRDSAALYTANGVSKSKLTWDISLEELKVSNWEGGSTQNSM